MKLSRFNKGQSLNRLDGNKNNNNIKRKTIVACAVVLVFAILLFSYARFESTANFELINGEIIYPTILINDKLISLAASGATDLAYDGTSDLGTNATSDNNLRYIGNNPNNFVSFNCNPDTESCEKWRIVGLFNNVQTPYGTESLVKITRAESIGNYAWDSSSSTINAGNGINQWGESGSYEGADLMIELNTNYLNSLTIDQSFVQEVIWNTGSNPSSIDLTDATNPSSLLTKQVYNFERGTDVSNTCEIMLLDESECNDNVTRTSSWTGKIGLIYYSDFLYATAGTSSMTRNQCFNTDVFNWSSCGSKSWLLSSYINGHNLSASRWTLTRYNNKKKTGVMQTGGNIGALSIANSTTPVYPTLYLQNHIRIVGGNGTEDNPYKLESGLVL